MGALIYFALGGIELGIPMVVIFGWFLERTIHPDWRLMVRLFLRVLKELPMVFLRTPRALIADGETFEVTEGDVEDVIGVTLVPDTIVVLLDETGMHVHRVVVKRSGFRWFH